MNYNDQGRANDRDSQEQDLADVNQLKHLLHQAMPPLSADQLEPRTDLWHQLRARLESESPAGRATNSNRDVQRITIPIPWFDWALAALAATALIFFPGIIPALLYHF